jgi:hypothetical protein
VASDGDFCLLIGGNFDADDGVEKCFIVLVELFT